MNKVTHITWNWSPATMETCGDRIDTYSDTCESASINDENVIKIEEHRPAGEGDKFFYDIIFTNGETLRIFNPNTVRLSSTDEV